MVMDAAFLAGTLASCMMNGACCMYQMNREEELREDLRKEIKKEWYRQRKRQIQKRHHAKDERRKEFEDRYNHLLNRSEEESYTQTHKFFGRTSPSPKLGDPPSQLAVCRSTSILEGGNDQDEETELMLVTENGSQGTLEDVSVS